MKDSTAFAALAFGCLFVAVVIVLAFHYSIGELCAHGVLHFC